MSFHWECLACHVGGETVDGTERHREVGAHADKWQISVLFHESSHVPFRLWEEHWTNVGMAVVNEHTTEYAGRIGW